MRATIPSAILAASMAAAPAIAGAEESHHPMRTIAVTGIGEASAAPDMALLNLGVETEAATAAEALRKNSAQMDATIKSLRDSGVDKKDIQTSGLNVSAKYDYSRDNSPPRLTGYQASNRISVKLRNLDKAGAVIDKAVSVGANRLDSISFAFNDPKPITNAARKDAVADARARAELYADAAGVKLGPVMQISDSYVQGPGPVIVTARMQMGDQSSTPIAPGESTISANVTIIYGIE